MLIKRLLLILFLFLILAFTAGAVDEPTVSASCAVLINSQTNDVIFEKNAYDKHSMASTTKIMTSLLAIESGKLFQNVTITPEMVATEGTSIGLKSGCCVSLETLVYGMMLESGNDAARSTAIFLGGSEENFAVMMNNRAKKIGMTSTNFVTASGLDSDEHYSSAYDMALLGSCAVKNPKFRDVCSTRQIRLDFIEPEERHYFSNHNRLLYSCEGVFGIKTGFTKKSGRCLVSACERDGVTLVAVTLNAPNDWNDHKRLYDYGFQVLKKQNIILRLPESVKVYGGTKSEIKIGLQNDSFVYSDLKDNIELTQKVYLNSFIFAPIEKNDIVGKVEILKNDKRIGTVDIVALENSERIQATERRKSFWERLKDKIFG